MNRFKDNELSKNNEDNEHPSKASEFARPNSLSQQKRKWRQKNRRRKTIRGPNTRVVIGPERAR